MKQRDEPQVDSIVAIILGVGALLIAAELVDVVSVFAGSIESNHLRGRVFSLMPFASAGVYFMIAYVFARMGIQGFYTILIGSVVSLFVLYNFRSYYIRFNTFDLFEDSRNAWFVPWFVGLTVGAAIGGISAIYKRAGRIPERLVWVMPMTLGLWGVLVWLLGSSVYAASWSDFPQTRHFALIGMAVVFFVMWLWHKRTKVELRV
jgi:hypothetical protein